MVIPTSIKNKFKGINNFFWKLNVLYRFIYTHAESLSCFTTIIHNHIKTHWNYLKIENNCNIFCERKINKFFVFFMHFWIFLPITQESTTIIARSQFDRQTIANIQLLPFDRHLNSSLKKLLFSHHDDHSISPNRSMLPIDPPSNPTSVQQPHRRPLSKNHSKGSVRETWKMGRMEKFIVCENFLRRRQMGKFANFSLLTYFCQMLAPSSPEIIRHTCIVGWMLLR